MSTKIYSAEDDSTNESEGRDFDAYLKLWISFKEFRILSKVEKQGCDKVLC